VIPIEARRYGSSGPRVVLLHGGPGAPGYLATLADALADAFRVLEPLQRRSAAAGGRPLTVARHVDDLHDLLLCEPRARGEPAPALVGHSWGAMLALAAAAAHPALASSLVLVGCGTFDRTSRARLEAERAARLDEAGRRRLAQIDVEVADPDARLAAKAALLARIEAYDPVADTPDLGRCDARAHDESWMDMLRLQSEGAYPAAFAAIDAPVLMLHGEHDTLPGEMIRASLAPFLPRLEYRALARCGHYPWLERQARHEFLSILRAWLTPRA
jgi:pimeloyl-ACP methyl ester carboxylesterase